MIPQKSAKTLEVATATIVLDALGLTLGSSWLMESMWLSALMPTSLACVRRLSYPSQNISHTAGRMQGTTRAEEH
jgi:hypothetical protein